MCRIKNELWLDNLPDRGTIRIDVDRTPERIVRIHATRQHIGILSDPVLVDEDIVRNVRDMMIRRIEPVFLVVEDGIMIDELKICQLV